MRRGFLEEKEWRMKKDKITENCFFLEKRLCSDVYPLSVFPQIFYRNCYLFKHLCY